MAAPPARPYPPGGCSNYLVELPTVQTWLISGWWLAQVSTVFKRKWGMLNLIGSHRFNRGACELSIVRVINCTCTLFTPVCTHMLGLAASHSRSGNSNLSAFVLRSAQFQFQRLRSPRHIRPWYQEHESRQDDRTH